MVSPMQLTVPSAAPMQISLSANPNQLKTERLENNLRLCGKNWLTNLKFSSLVEITKVHSSSQRSILARMSSASKIAETGLENLCSNLLPVEADKLLPLLHLSCLFLVFLLKCCNVFSLKPTRSMCDGRFFASSPFFRLACRGALFRGFPFRWVSHIVLSVTRGVIVHDAASCSREDSLDECGLPCDALSCLLFSALRLRCNQSLLVQETQSVMDIDMICSKMLPIKATTCLQVGPMSLDWPVDPFARFDFSRSSLSPEVPDDPQRGDPPTSHAPVEDSMLFKHNRRYHNVLQVGIDVALSFPKACDVLLGTPGVSLDLFSPNTRNREFKLKYFKRLFDANNILCLQEVHGKDEFLQAIQVLAPRFRFFGTFILDNENAGGSAICINKDILPEGAIVSHVITC